MGKVRLVVIFIAICAGIGRASFSPSINQQIVTACEDINKQCPQVCDSMTRLDSATPGNMRITYNYTITLGSQKITTEQLKLGMDAVQSEETANIRKDPNAKKLLDHGVTLCFRYKDEKGALMKEFTVAP